MEKKAEKNVSETEEGTSVDALVSADFAILYHKLYMVLSRVYKALFVDKYPKLGLLARNLF